jgi:hypothetical protein
MQIAVFFPLPVFFLSFSCQGDPGDPCGTWLLVVIAVSGVKVLVAARGKIKRESETVRQRKH